ncbi:MAG: histidine phosphotransferase family protein [Candidatus Pacebacteria bacterium]|nr:histidine phosphotransferase family protein [Candidatus Paceibacterota bacterium]
MKSQDHDPAGQIQIDLKLAQLWVSFLCHELISPVGAINNGIEFLEDQGASANRAETMAMAMDLMQSSGKQAAVRLKYFRLALGRAGGDDDLGIKSAVELVGDYFQNESRLKFKAATPNPSSQSAMTGRRVQLWLNLVLVVAATLQRGGLITAEFAADGRSFSLKAVGTVARLDPQVAALLSGDATVEVTPRNCLARLCGLLVGGLGIGIQTFVDLQTETKTESVTLNLSW